MSAAKAQPRPLPARERTSQSTTEITKPVTGIATKKMKISAFDVASSATFPNHVITCVINVPIAVKMVLRVSATVYTSFH